MDEEEESREGAVEVVRLPTAIPQRAETIGSSMKVAWPGGVVGVGQETAFLLRWL